MESGEIGLILWYRGDFPKVPHFVDNFHASLELFKNTFVKNDGHPKKDTFRKSPKP